MPTTRLPIPVDHKGNNHDGTNNPNLGKLDVNDDRLIMAQIRNNSLWTTHHIGVNNAGVSPATVQQSANTSFSILASNADFTNGTNTIHFLRNGIIDSNISITSINILTGTTLNVGALIAAGTPPGLYDINIQNSVLGNIGWNKCFLVNSPAFN